MKKSYTIGIVVLIIIVIIILYLYNGFFTVTYGYNLYEIPLVRSCNTENQCRGFGVSCVNSYFQPKKQEIISSAFPIWEFNDTPCVCEDYLITHLCEIKSP